MVISYDTLDYYEMGPGVETIELNRLHTPAGRPKNFGTPPTPCAG